MKSPSSDAVNSRTDTTPVNVICYLLFRLLFSWMGCCTEAPWCHASPELFRLYLLRTIEDNRALLHNAAKECLIRDDESMGAQHDTLVYHGCVVLYMASMYVQTRDTQWKMWIQHSITIGVSSMLVEYLTIRSILCKRKEDEAIGEPENGLGPVNNMCKIVPERVPLGPETLNLFRIVVDEIVNTYLSNTQSDDFPQLDHPPSSNPNETHNSMTNDQDFPAVAAVDEFLDLTEIHNISENLAVMQSAVRDVEHRLRTIRSQNTDDLNPASRYSVSAVQELEEFVKKKRQQSVQRQHEIQNLRLSIRQTESSFEEFARPLLVERDEARSELNLLHAEEQCLKNEYNSLLSKIEEVEKNTRRIMVDLAQCRGYVSSLGNRILPVDTRVDTRHISTHSVVLGEEFLCATHAQRHLERDLIQTRLAREDMLLLLSEGNSDPAN